jgi:TRAP-type C4-dicarboxylate transport system permease small subunit
MNKEYTEPEESAAEVCGLWLGMLGPPMLTLTHLQVTYALVPKICPTGNTTLLHIVSLCFLVIVIALGLPSWRCLRRQAPEAGSEDPLTPERVHFMAQLGLLTVALFALLIIAQAIPPFIVNPCQD